MDGQNKNLIFATVLSFFVILTWFFLFPPEELPQDIDNTIELTSDINNSGLLPPVVNTISNNSQTVAGLNNSKGAPAPRVEISTPNLSGSISLLGGRIDQLELKNYYETLEKKKNVTQISLD